MRRAAPAGGGAAGTLPSHQPGRTAHDGVASPYLVLPVSEVSTIVVEAGLPEAAADAYRELGVMLLATQ